MHLFLALAAPIALNACAARHPDAAPDSARTVELDLLRPRPGADKIYVQVDFPGGESGVFLVDTGASTSLLTDDFAERLGVVGESTGGVIAGLGGQVELSEGRLPWLSLGGLVVSDVAVAIGTPSLGPFSAQVPMDGILGNNVWGQLQVAIDYPADVLELALPGEMSLPEDAERMSFDGQHPMVPLTLYAGIEGGEVVSQELLLELDTGSRGVILTDHTGPGFESVATQGEEPILGVGAAENIPISAFYQTTRRVPLLRVDIGGVSVTDPGSAIWLSTDGVARGGLDMLGLVGYSVLKDHELILDYPGGRFALVDSPRPARQADGHALLLAQDIERYGKNIASRGLYRARLYTALDDLPSAVASLDGYLRRHPDNDEAAVIRARLLRYMGDEEDYWAAVSDIPPVQLTERGELLAATNWALLTDRAAAAAELVGAAVSADPESPQAQLARADLRYVQGDYEAAGEALSLAGRLVENPDAFLLRRARLALAEGDRYGALANLRRRLDLYPTDGTSLWFYAALASESGADLSAALMSTLKLDVDRTSERLHKVNRPLDFLMAAEHTLGDEERVGALLSEGLERDCQSIEEEPSRQNCTAWFYALAERNLDQAATLIQAALAAEPQRPDFLDTLAMVQLAQGDAGAAAESSTLAARRAPDVIYHLWQAERLRALAGGASALQGDPR